MVDDGLAELLDEFRRAKRALPFGLRDGRWRRDDGVEEYVYVAVLEAQAVRIVGFAASRENTVAKFSLFSLAAVRCPVI